MKSSRSLLILDRDQVFLKQFELLLSDYYTTFTANDEQQAQHILENEQIDAMFFNENSGDADSSVQVLKRLKALVPDLPVIVLTDNPSVEIAVEAIKVGAYHYGAKLLRAGELRALVEKA
ncbi:MAG TPA: response regulator, partial [Bacteroidota bacterium]